MFSELSAGGVADEDGVCSAAWVPQAGDAWGSEGEVHRGGVDGVPLRDGWVCESLVHGFADAKL
jgi:hypothetical protein